MGDFVTLTCPTCGGKLQITPDIDRFACTHCGNEHLVKRSEGVIAIQPLAESLTGLKRATDRTASELAIRRLTDDLAQLQATSQQAQVRAAAHHKIIDAHKQRRDGCVGTVAFLVLTPLCFLLYTASEELAKGKPESSLLAAAPYVIFLAMVVFGLCAAWGFLHWLLTSDPRPERKVAEENLRAAEAEVASATQAIAQRQAEIAQHQQLVGLGG